MLSSVPEHGKAVRCLREEVRGPEKLCSGLNYGTFGQELSVNDSAVYIK